MAIKQFILQVIARWWPKPKPLNLWYVRKATQRGDTLRIDTKRSQLWTSRDALLAEYHRRCPRLEQVNAVLYRWWDDEEYDLITEAEAKGGWRYFVICRHND